jgi:hypothetical protein
MSRYSFPRVAGLLSALFLCIQAPAQVTPENNPVRESVVDHVNRQAVLARAGDASATLELAHQMFLNAGIPIEIADSFGFTVVLFRPRQTIGIKHIQRPMKPIS